MSRKKFDPKSTFLLSLDGGGLYGLTQAIWLRMLAERDPTFLEIPYRESVPGEFGEQGVPIIFAGCSAGAINALLLAMHEEPRDAILPLYNGESLLERFWKEAGIYENTNPANYLLSMIGVTPWLGTMEMLEVLHRYFGPLKMGDLVHPVLISVYNWYGDRPVFPPWDAASTAAYNTPQATMEQWKRARLASRMESTSTAGRQWTPGWFRAYGRAYNFVNIEQTISRDMGEFLKTHFPDQPDIDVLQSALVSQILDWWQKQEVVRNDDDYDLIDVAYASTAMAPIRAIRGGVGDGAVSNPNPSMDLLVVADMFANFVSEFEVGFFETLALAFSTMDKGQLTEEHHRYLYEISFGLLNNPPMGRYRMLSLGAGEVQPSYSPRNFSFGPLPFLTLPVSGSRKLTPMSYMYNQAMQNVEMNTRSLLRGNYHRLNPDINAIPPGPVVYKVRNPFTRSVLITQVERSAHSPTSVAAVDEALTFLAEDQGVPVGKALFKRANPTIARVLTETASGGRYLADIAERITIDTEFAARLKQILEED